MFPILRCDGLKQCPRGDDEHNCQLDPATVNGLSELIICSSSDQLSSAFDTNSSISLETKIDDAGGFFALLVVLTFFSTPILTKIFGDGSNNQARLSLAWLGEVLLSVLESTLPQKILFI